MLKWPRAIEGHPGRRSSVRAFALWLAAMLATGCATPGSRTDAPQAPVVTPKPQVGAPARVLSASDIELADQTLQYGLNYAVSDATVEWRNPETGRSGTVTPLRTYTTADGAYCREFARRSATKAS